jgi:hypothetical protein
MWWDEPRARLVDGIVILDLPADVSMDEGIHRLRERVEQLLADSHADILLNVERVRFEDRTHEGPVGWGPLEEPLPWLTQSPGARL